MISHYYTRQGGAAKWSLPLFKIKTDPSLNACTRPTCSKQISRRGGMTETEYQKRKFCSQRCRDAHNDSRIVIEATEEEITDFKEWLLDNGYGLRSGKAGSKCFKIKSEKRLMAVYKSSGKLWRFAQGSIRIYKEFQDRSSETN